MALTEQVLWSNINDTRADAAAPALKVSRGEEMKRDFLRFFLEELKHQDPLSPMDHKDMAGQLAQFSSLEESVRTNGTLEEIRNSLSQQEGFSAAAWVGKNIRIDASTVALEGEGGVKLHYELPQQPKGAAGESEAKNIVLRLTDAAGNVVRTFSLKDDLGEAPLAAGQHTFTWNGRDDSGKAAPAGLYRFEVAAVTKDNDILPGARAQFVGRLDGVDFQGPRIRLKVANQLVSPQSILEVLDGPSGT